MSPPITTWKALCTQMDTYISKYEKECQALNRQKKTKEQLTKHLAKYEYFPCARTPAMWRHQTRNITFALAVNDLKYVRHEHFQHIIDALRDLYEITVDENGKKFLGLTIKWDYNKKK